MRSKEEIIYRLLHAHALHLGGMNGDVQSDLYTLAFNNGEKLEDFHSIILGLQQEIIFSIETVSTTRIIFQYMKALSKSDKIKSFIAPNITDLIKFLDNNKKIGYIKRGKYSCTLSLSRNYWIPNYIDNFISAL